MRKLAGRLSYSNVMATIAVFIALGAGAYAAVNLPKNSVKSKHIKNGQVKNKDLRDDAVSAAKLRGDVRSLHFDGSLPIGSLNDIILEEEGYRVAFECEDDFGSPQIDGNIRFPADGTLDIKNTTTETASDQSVSFATQAVVEASSPFPLDVSDAPSGEARLTGVVATYSGSTRAALLTVHGVTSDVTDTCTLNGSIIPLTQVE